MEVRREVIHFSFYMEYFERLALATLAVAVLTVLMYLIGRDQLGEGVIALLYLIPISWSTARWGQGAGIVAAVAAALAFNFFFPPFYTVHRQLGGWLLLGIFLTVAIVVVGRSNRLTRAARERRLFLCKN
jgi:two-component system sensor histidine kinase KdpD